MALIPAVLFISKINMYIVSLLLTSSKALFLCMQPIVSSGNIDVHQGGNTIFSQGVILTDDLFTNLDPATLQGSTLQTLQVVSAQEVLERVKACFQRSVNGCVLRDACLVGLCNIIEKPIYRDISVWRYVSQYLFLLAIISCRLF